MLQEDINICIGELEKVVLKNPEREEAFLLKESIECYKNGLYFASCSASWVFIEKYLRELLINEKMKTKKKLYDTIEKDYEDGYNDENKKFLFEAILKELNKKNILDKKDVTNLGELYKLSRIPIQHGIYRRFMKTRLTRITKGKEGKKLKDQIIRLTTSSGTKAKLYSRENRVKLLPIMLFSQAGVMFISIHEILINLPTYFKM